MITFTEIGRLGRFGNQLFQYCVLISVAKKNNYKYGIPKKNTEIQEEHGTTGISYRCNIFDIFEKDVECNLYHTCDTKNQYEDCGQEYNLNIFNLTDNTNLHGYFQSEKYFLWCESEIRNKLKFKKKLIDECKNYCDVYSLNDPIAVHIRRGDYLKYPHVHPTCTIDYYKTALNSLNSDSRDVLFFSDDINWVNENLTKYTKSHKVINTNSHLNDFIIMTQCTDFIIANSSYSWWAAWLSTNKHKKIKCPRKWFGTTDKITIQQDTRGFELL